MMELAIRLGARRRLLIVVVGLIGNHWESLNSQESASLCEHEERLSANTSSSSDEEPESCDEAFMQLLGEIISLLGEIISSS